MTDAPEQVFIEPGKRTGRALANEPAFRRAIGAGSKVITKLNGVYFAVSVGDDDAIVYEALAKKPPGMP